MYIERLSERERMILNILSETGCPMISQDIMAKNREIPQSTVQLIFRKLLSRGLIEVAEIAHSGNVPARAYVVTEKAKEEVLLHVVEEYQQVRDILSVVEYIMALIKSETDKDKQRQLIRNVKELMQSIPFINTKGNADLEYTQSQ